MCSNTIALFLSALVVSTMEAALSAPISGSATPGGPTTIAISWVDESFDEMGFEVERISGEGWDPVAMLPADQVFYYDRGLAVGATHTYRVRAFDDTEFSPWLYLGSATTTNRMNILFFFADDMGAKDIVALRNPAVDGPTIYETPALDTLAGQGIVFTNAYASGPRCVVAREALLTGRYDWRPGKHAFAATGLSPLDVTYADAVKVAGYRTGYIGKYHLGGSVDGNGPREQGFDLQIGSGHKGAPTRNETNGLAYFPDPVTLRYESLSELDYNMGAGLGLNAPAAGPDEYLTDRLTQEAKDFIASSLADYPDQPFFLTLAHYAVHTNIEAKQAEVDHFRARKVGMAAELATHPMASTPLIRDTSSGTRMIQDNVVYAAMIKSYDDSLAELRAFLSTTEDPRYSDGTKLSQTTVIVVSSDHGGKSTTAYGTGSSPKKSLENDATSAVNNYTSFPSSPPPGNDFNSYPTSNYPYRQGKTWVYEGGLKIPLMVYYPGLTQSGTVSNALIHGADFFATFADMAGADQRPEDALDSNSFMLPLAQPEASARKESFHFFTNASTGTANPALAAYRKGDYKLLYFVNQRRVELYNLAADLYERNDLSASRPDLTAEMLGQIFKQFLSTEAKMPKPGSNSWRNNQEVMVENGVIPSLPISPNAAPSSLTVTQLSETAIELNWTVNASNATHSIIYRDSPDDPGLREIAFVPVSQTRFVDTRFTPVLGASYKYRIESENQGGWNGFTVDSSGLYSTGSTVDGVTSTGTVAVTLAAMDPRPLVAVNDTITTVPGETREFLPLLNDEGEGDLRVLSLTQPTEGRAWIGRGGESIYYEAPAGFSGRNVTMTYEVTDTAAQSGTAIVTLALPIASSAGAIDLGHWDFVEPADTPLESTSSSTGISFGGTSGSAVATNGSGALMILPGSTDTYASSEVFPGGVIESGRVRFEFRVSASTLTRNNGRFGFALRDTGGVDRVEVLIRNVSGSVQIQVDNGSLNNLHDFGATTVTDLTVAATLNLDTGRIATAYSIDGGITFFNLAELDQAAGSGGIQNLRFSARNTKLEPSDEALVDYVRVEKLIDDISLYDVWATTHAWDGIRDTGAAADADGDGWSNLYEWAFGSSPTESGSCVPLSVNVEGVAPAFRLRPIRDTESIQYSVQFSSDLVDWDTLPEVPLNSPSGQLVEVSPPTLYPIFGRIRVSP